MFLSARNCQMFNTLSSVTFQTPKSLMIIIETLFFLMFSWLTVNLYHHHHHHVAPSAEISLTLSRHPPYRSSLTVGPQGYILYLHRAAVCRFSWSPCLCSAMGRGPQEYITYELLPTSPAVSRMSGSSNLDSFRGRW